MEKASWRHEWKYLCTAAEAEVIYRRLKAVLPVDAHAGQNGSYLVRSIYFDDIDDSYAAENEAGTDPREKWRLRTYNRDRSLLRLECKHKERGMTAKESCLLTQELFDGILNDALRPDHAYAPLLNRFLILQRTRLLRPVMIVSYTRIPFVCPDGNVRVTFDTDICSSTDMGSFFDTDMRRRRILPSGTELMELKYDAFFPDYLRHAMQLKNLRHTAFSKYYLCRKYAI